MASGRLGTAGRVTGKTSKAKQYASHKQAPQGTLSVKELSKDLEKAKQNEVLLKTRIRAVSDNEFWRRELHVCSITMSV